ncbi:hypothetical protein SADUNF_Sadunf08G0170100 [Salix dunnii]|uniref:Uncharacterized protein n=1 Tax=Salix dunnii TaxID=1413687 RepID=A0A835MYF4_9ROSI|nr:hypothetical protein SADUNF_Sadunf08G0170100 [Salix dunnii]
MKVTIDSPADQESDQEYSAINARDIRNEIMPYPAITREKSGRRLEYMQLSQEKNQDQDYSLHCDFAVKEFGALSYFWGVEVLRTNDAQESDQEYSAINARDIRNEIMPYPAITREKSGRRSEYMQLSQEKNQDQDYVDLR